jgi:hypothetical protein
VRAPVPPIALTEAWLTMLGGVCKGKRMPPGSRAGICCALSPQLQSIITSTVAIMVTDKSVRAVSPRLMEVSVSRVRSSLVTLIFSAVPIVNRRYLFW